MGLFSRWFGVENTFAASDIFTRLPGHWAGAGKIYTPAGVQNYRVELTLAAENTGTTGWSPNLTGRMVTFFDSGNSLQTDVLLKFEKRVWFLTYVQTNVHGQGKLSDEKLEFLQKDPTGKSNGQTVEIWNFLSADHLFIESFLIGTKGEKEPFLKIMLQKT